MYFFFGLQGLAKKKKKKNTEKPQRWLGPQASLGVQAGPELDRPASNLADKPTLLQQAFHFARKTLNPKGSMRTCARMGGRRTSSQALD